MLLLLLCTVGLVRGEVQEDKSRLGTPPELLPVPGASLRALKHDIDDDHDDDSDDKLVINWWSTLYDHLD